MESEQKALVESVDQAQVAKVHSAKRGKGAKNSKSKIIQWSDREDQILWEVVSQLKPKKWTYIRSSFNDMAHGGDPVKSAKQCRERWYNHVNPDLEKGNWSLDEDIYILESQIKYGNSWSKIAMKLKKRNENIVKNRWNTMIKQFKREFGSTDVQELLNLKLDEKQKKTPKILPVPVPVLPQVFLSPQCYSSFGILRHRVSKQSLSNSQTVSSDSENDKDDKPHLPRDLQDPDSSQAADKKAAKKTNRAYTYGFFVPMPDLQAMQQGEPTLTPDEMLPKLPNVFNSDDPNC